MNDTSSPALAEGAALGDYRIDGVLERDADGLTYAARTADGRANVAIREYLPQDTARRADGAAVAPKDDAPATRVAFEAGLAAFRKTAAARLAIKHTNLQAAIRQLDANGTAYLVLDLPDGERLDAVLKAGETLHRDEIDEILPPLVDGLQALHHAGAAHGNLNPHTVLIRAADGAPVLTDIGRTSRAPQQDRPSHPAGPSSAYRAPELLGEGSASPTPAADVYALGALLYRCITGRVPNPARERLLAVSSGQPDPLPAAIASAHAEKLVSAVHAALRLVPSERPINAISFRLLLPAGLAQRNAAAQQRAGRTVRMTERPAVEPPAKPAAKTAPPAKAAGGKRWRYAAAAFLAVALIGGAAAMVFEPWKQDGEIDPPRATIGEETKPEVAPAPPAKPPGAPSGKPGEPFRDCPECPEMVPLPAGKFRMGSPAGERGRANDEGPQLEIGFVKPFAIGKFEVTFDEFDACVKDKGCARPPDDQKWGRGKRPVVNVGWAEAKAYAAWLAKRTGKAYRLPSEAEWEYAARAGTETRFFWGDNQGRNKANCDKCGSPFDKKQTAPVGSFDANPFGLHDMHGNVWEWVEDCWHESLAGLAADGAARSAGECARRAIRGGSWNSSVANTRSANRSSYAATQRNSGLGFRVLRASD
jgi:formylglycine-generating enzyme required for sulfatase activity